MDCIASSLCQVNEMPMGTLRKYEVQPLVIQRLVTLTVMSLMAVVDVSWK